MMQPIFDLCLSFLLVHFRFYIICITIITINQNELKACHRTCVEIAFLLGAIAFNLHVAFSVDTEQNLSADFNHKFLCGFVVVMEAEKLEVCIHKHECQYPIIISHS